MIIVHSGFSMNFPAIPPDRMIVTGLLYSRKQMPWTLRLFQKKVLDEVPTDQKGSGVYSSVVPGLSWQVDAGLLKISRFLN